MSDPPPPSAPRDIEEHLAFALEAGRMASWEFDIATLRFTSSGWARRIFGLGPDEPFDRLEDLVARIHPDDLPSRDAAVNRALDAGSDLEVEYRVIRPSGQIAWVQVRGRAAYENGRPVRIAGILLDVTERKAAEAQQALLLAELNHRVKNTLALVQSIVLQTARGETDPAAFSRTLIDRIHALAQAHDLLTEGEWQGAGLAEVLDRTLGVRVAGEGPRCVVRPGPAVRLGPNVAVTVNLVFHELASNAVRHGALSVPEGRVDVGWTVDEAARDVHITWRESGGPPVAAPTSRGFGSRLIEQGLPRELGGSAELVFAPDGLECRIRVPLSGKVGLAG